jgi:hypothetical protein
MSLTARVAVNEVNERGWCGAVPAAALVAPARPSASTGISRKNSLMM